MSKALSLDLRPRVGFRWIGPSSVTTSADGPEADLASIRWALRWSSGANRGLCRTALASPPQPAPLPPDEGPAEREEGRNAGAVALVVRTQLSGKVGLLERRCRDHVGGPRDEDRLAQRQVGSDPGNQHPAGADRVPHKAVQEARCQLRPGADVARRWRHTCARPKKPRWPNWNVDANIAHQTER